MSPWMCLITGQMGRKGEGKSGFSTDCLERFMEEDGGGGGRMGKWVDGWMEGEWRMDGWMDGWVDWWMMGGWMDGGRDTQSIIHGKERSSDTGCHMDGP